MARRKAEVALQMAVESQEEWEELLSKEGLNVVDLYQEWCGPCTGMVANLRRLKNELGDDLLRFATAKADTIDSLEKYRGHCEPCFLFYAGGCLVAVVRGANSPKILRTITEQLKQEHKVLDGNSERKEIKDPFIAEKEAREKETDKEEEEEEEGAPGARGRAEGVKEVTVALIKPDAVAAGKVDEILNDIQAHGIQVLEHQERHMTVEEVESFYSHLKEEEYFDDLCKFMTSGPSHILVLTKGKTGENIISEFRDLIGPTDVEEAKTQAPESLRAKHGEKAFMNALHGSSSTQTAAGELAFFFPDFVIPACETAPKLQRTLALVRPEAFKLHKEDILSKIKESGFKVAMQKEMQLTKEMAEDFYKEHQDQPYFEQLVTNMSSGPVLALGLAREDAIQGWRDMLGPKEVDKAKEEAPESLRAQFAVDDAINSLHGSDSEQTAKKELEFFFPMEQTVAVIKPDAAGTKDEIIERIHEAGFRIAARKETTLSREVAEQFYSDHQGKDYYNELVDNMTSGPTYLMVLSREAAVDGWRSLIGPTDPTQAKEEAPESLRATYGENILKNAVHGSSNPAHAQESIKVLFGSNLKFAPDGSLLESIDEAPETEKDDKPVSQESKQVEEVAPENRESEEQQEQQQQSEGEQKQEETKPEQTDEEPKTETEMDTAPKSDSQTDGTETQVDVDTQQKEDTEQEASKPEEVPVHEIDKETSGDIDTDKKEENEVEESTQEADTGVEEVPTTEAPAGDIEAEVEEDKQETPTEEKTEEKPASPKPSESEAQQSETEAKPSEEEAKPSETETQQSETEAQPSESEAKPSESEAKPDEQTEEKTEEKKDEEEKKEEEQTEEKPKSPEAQTTQEESKEEEKKEEEKKEGAD